MPKISCKVYKIVADSNIALETDINGHGLIPLKVPNVDFKFDVSVGSIQMLTDTCKSNLTLGIQLQTIMTHF